MHFSMQCCTERTVEQGPRRTSHQLTYSGDEKGKFCHCFFHIYFVFLLLVPKSSCLSASTSSISLGAKEARVFTHRGTTDSSCSCSVQKKDGTPGRSEE